MRLFPGSRPKNLGVHDGMLAPAPRVPNGVSSQADRANDAGHFIEPIDCRGDPAGTWTRLVAAVRATPRTDVIAQTGDYLHAECASKGLGFVDDLECWLDRKAGVIHVRSAARLGIGDFGVNRKRVERLRAAIDRV